jgi:hypothetical protein
MSLTGRRAQITCCAPSRSPRRKRSSPRAQTRSRGRKKRQLRATIQSPVQAEACGCGACARARHHDQTGNARLPGVMGLIGLCSWMARKRPASCPTTLRKQTMTSLLVAHDACLIPCCRSRNSHPRMAAAVLTDGGIESQNCWCGRFRWQKPKYQHPTNDQRWAIARNVNLPNHNHCPDRRLLPEQCCHADARDPACPQAFRAQTCPCPPRRMRPHDSHHSWGRRSSQMMRSDF